MGGVQPNVSKICRFLLTSLHKGKIKIVLKIKIILTKKKNVAMLKFKRSTIYMSA